MRDTTILGPAALLALALGPGFTVPAEGPAAEGGTAMAGVWRTADGTVRLTLRADFSYALNIAGRRRTAQGSYRYSPVQRVRRDPGRRRAPAA